MNLTVPLSLGPPQANVAHVWQLQCSAASDVRSHWLAWLSKEERQRWSNYRRETDRDRFIYSRGGLRYLLASYLDQLPTSLQLAYGHHGKPYLTQEPLSLSFNVAHSGDWVVFGFSHKALIGVDVEVLQPRRRLSALIQRCLTVEEQAQLPAASEARLAQFLRYWTLKEAHLKAIGLGLSYPIKRVQVALAPTSHLICPAQVPDEPNEDWQVELWQPSDGAIAAVCIGQAECEIQRFRLTPMPPSG
ncbi:MAG: 4'-phosphopantetheinyl transferase superfamily protein [Cyanobacteria bacterium P01_H01_bin.153]